MNVVFPTSLPPWTTTVTLDLPGEERESEKEREREEKGTVASYSRHTPFFRGARSANGRSRSPVHSHGCKTLGERGSTTEHRREKHPARPPARLALFACRLSQ